MRGLLPIHVQTSNREASCVEMGGMFDYTQGKYWGGPSYSYWTLIVISVLGGCIGLDHLWMRSPQTAILKALLMIPTLGLWYFYDLLQIFGEKDLVMKYGLSAPCVGPLGVGAEMFLDDHPGITEDKKSKSVLRYMAYFFLLWLPFGFDLYIAGDTNGAGARFLSSIIPFLWPIGFIWGCLNIIRAIASPKSVFDNGTSRMFPFTFFMNDTGPSKLGPKDIGFDTTCDPGGSKGFFAGILSSVTYIFSMVANILLPGVQPAIQAMSGFVASLFGFSSAVVKAATNPAAATTAVASTIVQTAPSALAGTQGMAEGVGAKLQESATAQIAQRAVQRAVQTGGARIMSGTMSGSISGPTGTDVFAFPALMFALVALLTTGGVLAFLRLKRYYDLSRNVDESDQSSQSGQSGQSSQSSQPGQPGSNTRRDDSPPRPHVL